MKHVWILNHYAQEPGGPGGTRHFSIARHLHRYGWRASIVAAGIEHVTGRDRLEPGERQRLEVYAGVPFLWFKTSPYSGNGSDRIRNMLEYSRQAASAGRLSVLDPPDAVIGSSVHLLAALAGWRQARRHAVPFLFEVRDLWPQTLIDMGRLSKGSATARAMAALERFLYRRACRVITLLPHAADYIAPLGVERERIMWISNGADLETFPVEPIKADQTGPFDFMYLGAHGHANSLQTLVHAMAILKGQPGSRPVRLRMIGDGPQKAGLIQLADTLGVSSIVFEPPVSKARVPAVAAEADAFVLCLQDLPGLYRFGISLNKLFDYLGAGRPVVLASGATNDPVAEAGAGVTVPPENPEKLAEAMRAVAAMEPAERIRMGLAGRRHVEEHYSYERLAGRLASALDACCKEAR